MTVFCITGKVEYGYEHGRTHKLSWEGWSVVNYQKHTTSPVVVHLVDHEDAVADLFLVEKGVHEGNEDEQLLKALSEGDDQGELVRSPGGVVHRARGGCLGLHRAGLLLLLMVVLGGACVGHPATAAGGHVPRAAELEQDEGDQPQDRAEPKQFVDRKLPREEPVGKKTNGGNFQLIS